MLEWKDWGVALDTTMMQVWHVVLSDFCKDPRIYVLVRVVLKQIIPIHTILVLNGTKPH